MRLRARNLLAGLGMIVSALASQLAVAAPPIINTGASIPIDISNLGRQMVVNLRDLNAIAGEAPLTVTDVTLLVNGQSNSLIVAAPLSGVCIVLDNLDFGVSANDAFALRLTVTNAQQESAGPAIVPIANMSGPVVADPAALANCDEASAQAANAGPDQTVDDTDAAAGEVVTLDASGSTGNITGYQWVLDDTILGTSQTITTRLPDGVNTVTLFVSISDGESSTTDSDTVVVTVNAAAERTKLSDLPNLTPNQKRMASGLDDICGRVLGLDDGGDTSGEQGLAASKPAAANQKVGRLATEAEQSDLADKCRGLLFNNTAANQVEALDELNGEDFAVARTQTLLFANFQYAGILDRLMALRGGAKGLSLAGLNIMMDGKAVPLATLQKMAADLFGGGASSDADEVGGLLSDKWGMWMRGNYSTGKKDASAASPSFDADQFALIGGLDYRLSEKAVIGASMAYGDSTVEFNPRSEGGLDTTSWALSAYGSMYAAQNFYLDGIFNVADSDYAADRNITYVDGQGLVNTDARGDTGGMTLSGGLSVGYDFLVKGLTISPNLGLFYIDATIDSFTERGAGGLNLIYDEQNFKSLTSNLGLRVTYAWNHTWGVLLPHVRVDYVREFEDDVDVFGIRFAADPNAGSTPPILVETDNPDTSYWRLAAGFSAQFQFGFSGYVEYQRLESFQFISFQDVSVGLRMQKSF